MDARAETGHTPLHGALMKDQSKIVELLLGYGADPTIADSDENTPLHIALGNEDLRPPSDNTLELNRVSQEEKCIDLHVHIHRIGWILHILS